MNPVAEPASMESGSGAAELEFERVADLASLESVGEADWHEELLNEEAAVDEGVDSDGERGLDSLGETFTSLLGTRPPFYQKCKIVLCFRNQVVVLSYLALSNYKSSKRKPVYGGNGLRVPSKIFLVIYH